MTQAPAPQAAGSGCGQEGVCQAQPTGQPDLANQRACAVSARRRRACALPSAAAAGCRGNEKQLRDGAYVGAPKSEA